jgi:ankyrin repeat protein
LTFGIACLLNNGADPNLTDSEGRTPLHIIARKGVGKNQVNMLIEHGADMNACDNYQRTPRDYADEASRDSVARHLAACGASVS